MCLRFDFRVELIVRYVCMYWMHAESTERCAKSSTNDGESSKSCGDLESDVVVVVGSWERIDACINNAYTT